MKGTIKVLKDGFGFLKIEEGSDVFFHANDLEGVEFKALETEQVLEFEIGEGRNGQKQAVNVTLVQD